MTTDKHSSIPLKDYNSERFPAGSKAEHLPGGELAAAVLFYVLLAALLVPIWFSAYFPSSDGPSHLFNSYIYLNYGHSAIFQQAYTLHVPTAGNLAGHALAIFLLKLGFSWSLCEKLILTICLTGLALAFRYALRGVKSAPLAAALLVLPFLYNWPFQMGFWSFSLGVPFLLIGIGLCFRYCGRWSPGSLFLLFLAVAAVYVCHPISWAVCGLVVALMTVAGEWSSLLTQPGNRRRSVMQIVLPLAVFVPFAVPNLVFASQNEFVKWDPITSPGSFLWPLYTASPIHLFTPDARPARALFILFALASILNLWFRTKPVKVAFADVLLPISVLLMLMGLFSPGRIGEGTYLGVRILLFGYLTWALWLATTSVPKMVPLLATFTVAVTLWLVLARVPAWRDANRELTDLVSLGRSVPANSFVCQIDFGPTTELVSAMEHAIDLLPAHQVVDVRDYEAGRYAFWTRFRPGYFLDEDYMALSSRRDFEGALNRFESRTGKKVDFIFLTDLKISPDESMKKILPARWDQYELLRASEKDAMALFKRKD